MGGLKVRPYVSTLADINTGSVRDFERHARRHVRAHELDEPAP
jgi:hypothetical protein